MSHRLILIAHDEEDFTQAATLLLAGQGWLVEIASNGLEAIFKVKQRLPRLVIVKLAAPAINTFELIRTIRSESLATTILIAANGDPESAVSHALEAGAYDLVPSPLHVESFLAAIRRALERQDLLDELAALRKALKGENGAVVGISEQGIKLEAVERELLMRALAKFQGNQTKAARYLDISRRTLIYRMDKYKLRGEQ